jgi:hypothetical protein
MRSSYLRLSGVCDAAFAVSIASHSLADKLALKRQDKVVV